MVLICRVLQHPMRWMLILIAFNSVVAQTPASIPQGIDLVVLIDHSGSMWGLKAIVGDKKSDPYGHRIHGVQNLFKRLLDDVENTTRLHQLSVIEFGDQAKTLFSGLEITFKPGLRWRSAYETYFELVQTQHLRNTNTAAAFELAEREISKMAANIPSKTRRKIVCLITDGRPAMPGAVGKTLKPRIVSSLGEIREHDGELWVLAIDAQLGYWDGKEEVFWKGLTPKERAVKAEPIVPNLPNLFNNFSDDWLGRSTKTISNNPFVIPPYLQMLRVAVTLDTPGSWVDIYGPDGRKLPKTRKTPSDQNVYFEMRNPVPGEYRIETDSGSVIAPRLELIPHKLVRVSPTAPADPGTKVPIRFELRDPKGKPLPKHAGYPIETTFVMTDPDGNRQELPETSPNPKQTVFEMQWTPSSMGQWQVKPQGMVTIAGLGTIDIFAGLPLDASNQLEVTDREPLMLRLVSPKPKRGLRVLPFSKAATLTFELLDANGTRVSSLADLVNEPETWLWVQIIDKNGTHQNDALALTLKGENRFAVKVPLQVDWRRGKGTLFPDYLNFSINVAPDRLPENYYLHSLKLSPTLEGNRLEGNLLSLSNMPIRMALWLWLLVWLLLAILVGLLLFLLVRTWGPNWSTARRDARNNTRWVLLIFDEIHDASMNNAIQCPVEGKAFHKFDKAVSVDVDGEDKVADRFRVARQLVGGQELAVVSFRWAEEAKQRKGLRTIRVKQDQQTRLDGIAGKNYAVILKDLNQ